jgi:hypothetical protein
MLTLWSNVCIIWVLDPMAINDRRSHCLMVGHCRMYITSSVGHPRLDSVGLLVLWTVVAYNGLGHWHCITSLGTASTLLRMCNISGRLYC